MSGPKSALKTPSRVLFLLQFASLTNPLTLSLFRSDQTLDSSPILKSVITVSNPPSAKAGPVVNPTRLAAKTAELVKTARNFSIWILS